MTFVKTVALSVAALTVFAATSFARDGRCGWGGGGPRWSVGIGVGAPVYYGPAYYPRPYYYEPAPVVVAPRPVVVGRVVGGDVVVDAQRALARRGYYCGVVDGDLGPQSRAAIRAWQADAGLAVTGSLNAATLRSLGLL